jgi:hypothetical protein
MYRKGKRKEKTRKKEGPGESALSGGWTVGG